MPHGLQNLHVDQKLKELKNVVKPQAENVKKSLISVSFLTLAVKTCALVLFYYVFSIGLTFYNQRFVKVIQTDLNACEHDEMFHIYIFCNSYVPCLYFSKFKVAKEELHLSIFYDL